PRPRPRCDAAPGEVPSRDRSARRQEPGRAGLPGTRRRRRSAASVRQPRRRQRPVQRGASSAAARREAHLRRRLLRYCPGEQPAAMALVRVPAKRHTIRRAAAVAIPSRTVDQRLGATLRNKMASFEKQGWVSIWVGVSTADQDKDVLRDLCAVDYYDVDFQ